MLMIGEVFPTHKTKGCHRVVIELSISCHLLTTLRLSGVVPVITSVLTNNFLVVPNVNLDNFLDDNHKVVIVTIRLTTFRQLFVLCECIHTKGMIMRTSIAIWKNE